MLKPGAGYACSEHLLAPRLDGDNEEHVSLQKAYLPTLTTMQSMYPTDVEQAKIADLNWRIVAEKA